MAGVDGHEWQGRVGKSWAAEWQRTDRSFAQLTAELQRCIHELRFTRVLDIGCGAGELTVTLASVHPNADFVGVDVSPDLLDVARKRAFGLPNAHFELVDAAAWRTTDDARPDLLMSRHGVMFFEDPLAAFANLRQSSAAGSQMIFSCFRAVEHNPFFGEVGRLVPPDNVLAAPDPYAPGPFAFADDVRVRQILVDAGWLDIKCVPFDFSMIAGSGNDPVADAVGYFSRIGPAARALASMEGGVREAMLEALAGLASRNLRNGIVALGASAWIVAARNS